jgi:hypothetical protein
MEWQHYWQNVVHKYQAIIEGRPGNIPFHNLSDISNSLHDLETLRRKWRAGKTYWKKFTTRELWDLDLHDEHDVVAVWQATWPVEARGFFPRCRCQKAEFGHQDRDPCQLS